MIEWHDKQYRSSAEIFFEMFNDRLKLTIIWHLQNGPLRFTELKEALNPVTKKTLAAKLKELEALHLITREVFAEVPPRVEYSLSDTGAKLKPVIDEILAWSQGYVRAYAELKEED